MAENTVTITVDGREVTVAAGTNVVDAAREAGISIPVFCYHPRMQAVGMCRMCLVSIGMPRIDRATGKLVLGEDGQPEISMLPKLQTACTTQVSQGMVVQTDTEQVKFAQRGVLEFLLTSHPLDCPVCDKGGECPLQNLTMEWGPGESRFDYSNKVHFQKPVPLGDLILLDRERCILCGRCVRFQDELADDPVLGFDQRGRAWHIISKSEPPFDSKFSGNTTDICPVGALTSADFRFKARVWELRPVPSLCTHCSVGCNITLDMRHNQIKRVMPRENTAVNDIWICDKGRYGLHFVESEKRLTTPLIRRGDQRLVQATWEEAIAVIAEKLVALHRSGGSDVLAGLVSERLSNEDLYLFQRLFRDALSCNNLDHRSGAPGEPHHDDIGALVGVGSGTNIMDLGKGSVVLVIGADPEEEAPLYMLRLREIAKRGGELFVLNGRPTKLDRSAKRALHYRPGSEPDLLRGLLSVVFAEAGMQHVPPRSSGVNELRSSLNMPLSKMLESTGLSDEDIRTIGRSFAQAEHGIIVYGADAMALGPGFTQDLGTLALVAGKVGKPNNGLIPLLRRGNTRGALDMGVRPDKRPGYAPLGSGKGGKAREVVPRGLDAREIWGAAAEGQLKALYIAGLDPATEHPASRATLEKLEFLVVQDMFLTPTAELAHVVLPTQAFAERDGTYTNAERRVQRARQARQAPGECRADWEIVRDVALQVVALMGEAAQSEGATQQSAVKEERKRDDAASLWDYTTARDVALEIAERVPGYQGITYSRLAKTAVAGSWGRQATETFFYDGTSYDNTEGVGIQYPAPMEAPNAAFTRAALTAEPLAGDASRYPFVLVAQTVLYDGDARLHGSLLESHVPELYVIMSATDADQAGIQTGDRVLVSSAVGAVECAVRLDERLPAGAVVIPAHLPGEPLAAVQMGLRTRVAVQKAR
jgi:NADH-quinone oxidoreductase subunit G